MVEEENEGGDPEEEDWAEDPVMTLNLEEVLAADLWRFAAADAVRFQQAVQYLTQTQREALQRLG